MRKCDQNAKRVSHTYLTSRRCEFTDSLPAAREEEDAFGEATGGIAGRLRGAPEEGTLRREGEDC